MSFGKVFMSTTRFLSHIARAKIESTVLHATKSWFSPKASAGPDSCALSGPPTAVADHPSPGKASITCPSLSVQARYTLSQGSANVMAGVSKDDHSGFSVTGWYGGVD